MGPKDCYGREMSNKSARTQITPAGLGRASAWRAKHRSLFKNRFDRTIALCNSNAWFCSGGF